MSGEILIVPGTKTHRYKELRPGQLRAFREVVRRKSFSAAARALEIAQPTLWEQVRALERSCGAALLERHGREWKPTEDGLLALELANSIVDALESFQETFKVRQEDLPRQLVISSIPGALTEDLAEPIVAFCRAHPQIHLRFPSHVSVSITELVLIGEVDFGCIVLPQGELLDTETLLRREILCQRPAALFLPRNHPLATQRRLTLTDLTRYPLILPGLDSLWRQRIDEVFRHAGLLGCRQILLEVTPTHAARRYASLGLAGALFPLPRDTLKYPRLQIRLVDDLLPPEEVVLICPRIGHLRPQAQLFIDFVRARLAGERT